MMYFVARRCGEALQLTRRTSERIGVIFTRKQVGMNGIAKNCMFLHGDVLRIGNGMRVVDDQSTIKTTDVFRCFRSLTSTDMKVKPGTILRTNNRRR